MILGYDNVKVMENHIQKENRKIRDGEIWRLYYESGLTMRELGKRFKLTHARIGQIIQKRQKDILNYKDIKAKDLEKGRALAEVKE